ncbi:iron-sulfur cluster assembly accessory protein [Paenibacillus taichungensis]|uniref:HesB/IscA family protein n=1 Tax=Paenibacillus taichungensis TaxID=484184 RepID=UPI002870C3E5|nr:iron-sulfur cluster assembly accessory protein [Paenibacillus taichungensis]MDR9745793.1 iron-sulfur cluster assembly accessory protein [Paenibacillus taichungensis]MEC0107612.1 iron-sulfur cluster assembly accessory protein [Paenibacillus taichungensis]MEC0195808.1 iron-sulfur cluster assembly accessory protein [Paenibacillus taichungensis]
MIQVSEAAAEKIVEILASADTQNSFLRVGVDEGGCSGLSYNLIVDEQQEEGDILLDKGVFRILVHTNSVPYIEGLEIDYEESGMLGGFTMNNPNAKVSCGCGASFRLANYRGEVKKCD